MSNTPMFVLPWDQTLTVQTSLFFSQKKTWNITVVAGNDAYNPEESEQPVPLIQAELNHLTLDQNLWISLLSC